MNVRAPRQRGGIDLDYGPDHHQLPLRPQLRNFGNQLEIETFVDNPGVADTGPGDVSLIGRRFTDQTGGGKMIDVDTAGARKDVGMPVALCLEQTDAPGKHHVGPAQQLRLVFTKLRRSAAEE